MVSKCANPGCSAPFHYLREGKVFRLQVEGAPTPGPQLLHPVRPVARVEHFWLCGACASTLTLLVDQGRVVTVPLTHAQYHRAAAS